MSGAARERVLANLEKKQPRRRGVLAATAVGMATFAAAAAALVVMRPDQGFTAKGSAIETETSSPHATIVCLESVEREKGPCHVGDTLLFQLDGASPAGFFAAYASPVSSPESRVWYFPEANGAWPSIAADVDRQTLPRGIRLGSEHSPGRYVVHVLVARRPLDKEAAIDPKNPDVLSRSSLDLEILP